LHFKTRLASPSLYERELESIKKKAQQLKTQLDSEKSEIEESRKRDYNIYKACVETAYTNDILNNRDTKITDDELSILVHFNEQSGTISGGSKTYKLHDHSSQKNGN
jgi:hypothetical protein